MSTLTWTDTFRLDVPRMDDTHREFVDCLAALEAAAGDAAASATALDALVVHTVAHFEQEERWMAALNFAPENCHGMQHRQVLEVVREVVRRQATAHDREMLESLVKALAEWFPVHATMMDAALAMTMAERGFDPESGLPEKALEPEAAAITGCGSGTCG